jgi:hypothetical protein
VDGATASSSLTIFPAPLDKAAILLQCPESHVVDAVDPLTCNIKTFDAYSNVQGAELDLNAMATVGYVDGGEEFSLELSYVEFGVYQATFHPTISGLWTFDGFFNSELFKGSDTVRVIGGALSAADSSFECPSETAASGQLYCAIYARDQHGNPTDGGSALETAFQFFATADQLDASALIEIMPAEMHMSMEEIIANTARLDHGEHSGTYVALITVPEVDLLTVGIFHIEGTQQTALGDAQDVTVAQVSLSFTLFLPPSLPFFLPPFIPSVLPSFFSSFLYLPSLTFLP